MTDGNRQSAEERLVDTHQQLLAMPGRSGDEANRGPEVARLVIERAKAIEDLASEGWTRRQTAQRLGVARQRVSAMLNQAVIAASRVGQEPKAG
jgi:hypothetical protein